MLLQPAACSILFRRRKKGGRRPGDGDHHSSCYYNKTPQNKMAYKLRGLEVQGQDDSLDFGVGPASLYPHVAKVGQERLLGFLYKGVNLHLRDSFHHLITSQKTCLQIVLHWGFIFNLRILQVHRPPVCNRCSHGNSTSSSKKRDCLDEATFL